MQKVSGKSVCGGFAIGPVLVLKKQDVQITYGRVEDAEEEVGKVERALHVSGEQLHRLYKRAVREAGEEQAAIFEAHQMIMEDADFLDAIYSKIRTEQANAEYAVSAAGKRFEELFANMEDDYMRARAADIRDITRRLLCNLKGVEQPDYSGIKPSVIVADDLTPSETVQMGRKKILALVTGHGSVHSHAAILARTMHIPAIIGAPLNLSQIQNGMTAIVDGAQGEVIFNPVPEVLAEAEKRITRPSRP